MNTAMTETFRAELGIQAIREITRLLKAGHRKEAIAFAQFASTLLYPQQEQS
jgi:hypothetical protein